MTVVEIVERSIDPVAEPVQVLIVDDHRILREGLGRSLGALGLSVVGEAGSGVDALRAAASLGPDVVLMDVALPDIDGISVARRMKASNPEIRVVMLTMFADNATIRAARSAGADGYLTKDCSTSDIETVLRVVTAGCAGEQQGFVCSETIAERDSAGTLSRREIEVLQLVAEGKTTAAVARELFISLKTVKNHLANIYQKLDVRDRTQAVVQGLRLGFVQLR